MKTNCRFYLGFDLGASSGRAVLGSLDHGRLCLKEIHRFSNGPVDLGGTLYWDFLGLWRNVLESLRLCGQTGARQLAGIGVATWGVDSGFLGRDGQLLANPLCYRDRITEGTVAAIAKVISADRLYELTGLAPGRITSLAQLVGLSRHAGGERLRQAETFLMMPDLFRYFLCGHRAVDITAAGSAALVNVRTVKWCGEVFRELGLPRRIMPPLAMPGTVAGKLHASIAEAAGINRAPVMVVAGHDTLSAAAAAPAMDDETVFISCGTWSVVGSVRQDPITTPAARRAGYISELGVESILLAKNITGLYLFENLRRALAKKGEPRSYAQMIKAGVAAKPFERFLDVNAPEFFVTEDPLVAIAAYLKRTRQKPLGRWADASRAILEGIAWSYRVAVRDLAGLTGQSYRRVSLVGGGCRNRVLCQWTADATGLPVAAGPVEATVAGNLALQAAADGTVKGAAGVRALVARSFGSDPYTPRNPKTWDQHFARYHEAIHQLA